MKMIVGLGNPGIEFNNTRHNIGFIVIDHFCKSNKLMNFKEKYNGLYQMVKINNESVLLLKPLSYMNLSGTVIKKFASFYKINPQDILIIQDDLDMPVGKIKLKYKGSSGGHNGIKNIISELKTENFPRFKLGIGRDLNYAIKDYVLSKFNKSDEEKLEQILTFSDEILEKFVTDDFEKVMSKYNGENYEFK